MKSTLLPIVVVVIAHVIAVGLLIAIGIALNDAISQKYTGAITMVSIGVGVYSTAANVLYRWNKRFFLFVNRVRMLLVRTHTFWQPHFLFEFAEECKPQLLDVVWDSLSEGKHGNAVKKAELPTAMVVVVDDLMSLRFRLDECFLYVSLEQKLLVPAHLYDKYRQRLIALAEAISAATKPAETRWSMQISFDDGVENPYYGFFIRRTPSTLLENFQVSFRLSGNSRCRIEAGMDSVKIDATSALDMNTAISEILSLKALPE